MMPNFNEYGIIASILVWLSSGFLPFLFQNLKNTKIFFVPTFISSLLIVYFASFLLSQETCETLILPLGLLDFPFLIRIDSLSSFFLIILGLSSAGISLHASSYFRDIKGRSFQTTFVFYHLFLVGMAWVFIANDGYSFLIAWELMALSSYFLVTVNHHSLESRKAGFIYLLISHMGALALLLALGVMQHGMGSFSFDLLRQVALAPHWKMLALLLAFLGFAFKAGLVPFHVWLPEAHPAAPSPISAIMSGVMVKTAIYGFIRFAFDILGGNFPSWVGLILLIIGLFSAFYAVIYAIAQTDMKRLLAFSTIENMGLIFAITGLSLSFSSMNNSDLSALALVAVLYHCLSHAFFKSLLFLSTGNVLHATGERNLGKLGGLIRFMPWVAIVSLIGVIGMAGLPPLNGFVSEWLMLQSFLSFAELSENYLRLIMPLCAALFILVAGLAGYMSVKFFGVIFLGQPREKKLNSATDALLTEKIALSYFAFSCFVLGIFPSFFISALKPIAYFILKQKDSLEIFPNEALTLVPISIEKASYNPLLYLIFILGVTLVLFTMVRFIYHRNTRRIEPWRCGLTTLTPRMQDTAEGFGQPLKNVFGQFMKISQNHFNAFDDKPKYISVIHDLLWEQLYIPIIKIVEKSSRLIAKIQQGKINIYLTYNVVALIILLVIVRWKSY
ncbi:MAG: hydrogenase 4 subunit B [Candidatus Berkiella sp.]